MSPVEKLFLDNWPIRRRWLRLALIWMALNVQTILVVGFFKIEIASSPLHQNALITMLTAIVSLIGFYVFGAIWDDNSKRSRFRPRCPDIDLLPQPTSEPAQTIAPDEPDEGEPK